MILATRDDIDYPHIDWVCEECGTVYRSSGEPDTDYCAGGNHPAHWKPEEEQMEEYIDLLNSLEVGDGVLFAGDGPAPLMAPVKEVGENYLITESIDSPSRKIRWDGMELEIEQTRMDQDHEHYSTVYHVDTVEVLVEA